jgi:hypothetical protein
MKSIMAALLLILTIGTIGAVDLESYQFIDRLLSLQAPGAPVIFEDSVIFTAPSSYRRVGISFAHENFSRVHWYEKLMVPEDPAVLAAATARKEKNINPNKDSGMLFHVQLIPEGIQNMDYRMIIDGLWTPDPHNPVTNSPQNSSATTAARTPSLSAGSAGIILSRVVIPALPSGTVVQPPAGTLRLNFSAAPGETITVGGSFNSWDPFMYEMEETRPGFYTFTLPLPSGTYQYVFFHRGERILDPYNFRTIYTKEGKTASETEVR